MHKAFGENIAVLASYVLIAEGYGTIHANAEIMKKDARFASCAESNALFCLKKAAICGGIQGAANGQFLDLFLPDGDLKTLEKVVAQKTSTLFEIAFLFGWLFGGGSIVKAPLLSKCAAHLGMLFQIRDDLEDDIQDASRVCDANVAKALGRDRASFLLDREREAFQEVLKELGLWTPPFQELDAFLA